MLIKIGWKPFVIMDWLEGLFFLDFIFAYLGMHFPQRPSFLKNYFIAYLVLFFIAFSKTLFSMSIQSMEVSLSLLLGFLNFKLNQLNKCRLYKKA